MLGNYVLVAIDEYNHFTEVTLILSTLAKVVTYCLYYIFIWLGLLAIVKTYNGPPIQSQENLNCV